MPEPWFDHVVSEINKCDQNAARLLEITTQVLYWENIALIPKPIADALIEHIYRVNDKPDPAGRWKPKR